jgi:hypothetical protein
LAADGGFVRAEAWLATLTRIEDGVAVLQARGDTLARIRQRIAGLQPNRWYVLSVRLRAQEQPDCWIIADVIGDDYESPDQKLRITPEQVSAEFRTFSRVIPSGDPPGTTFLRVYTPSTVPVVLDSVGLSATTVSERPPEADPAGGAEGPRQLVASGGFEHAAPWRPWMARIADGVAILSAHGDSGASRVRQPIQGLKPNCWYRLAVRIRADQTPDSWVMVDLIGDGYESPEQKLRIMPAEISSEFKTFERVIPSGSPPASVLLRLYSFSSLPVVVDDVHLSETEEPPEKGAGEAEDKVAVPPPLVANGSFDSHEGWRIRSARIVRGVAVLECRRPDCLAQLRQPIVGIESDTRYLLSLRAKSDQRPDRELLVDMVGDGFEGPEFKLRVQPKDVGRDFNTHARFIHSGEPPDPAILRVTTASSVPIFIDDIALTKAN